MATQIICDACGEPIDQSQPFFQVVATKVQVENANDPTQPNTPTVVGIAQTFDYHDGHQPDKLGSYTPPEEPPVEPPALSLTNLNPTSGNRSAQTDVTAIGTGFDDTAVVVVAGMEVATTFTSDTELGFTVDGPALGAGYEDVLVRQGGTDTAAIQFRVT
jgi:hypothetical protein